VSVERENALDLANLWVELPEAEAPGNVYGQMMNAIRQLVPDSVTMASAAIVDGVPSIVAFDDDSLFIVRLETTEAGTEAGAEVIATRQPLRPGEVTVELRESMTDRGGHVRDWTFALGQQTAPTIRAYVARGDGWADGPSDSERFARELARKVGWRAPFERERP